MHRAEAIRREKPGKPPIVIGDPKTGTGFALNPNPYFHGVFRRQS